MFQPHRNFSNSKPKNTPLFAACFTFSRLLFTHYREKKTNHTPTQLEIIHHQKISSNLNFSLLLFLQRRTQFSNQSTSFYFCFNLGHGEIFDQSIILLLFQPQRGNQVQNPCQSLLLFQFSKFEAIFKQTTGSFYFLFQPQRNFRPLHATHHHATHTHTHTNTKKETPVTLLFVTLKRNLTKEFSNEKNQKSQQTHSLTTLYFLFQPRSQFSNTPPTGRSTFVQLCRNFSSSRNRAGCVVFEVFFFLLFVSTSYKKSECVFEQPIFTSLCLLDGVVFCVNMPCFVFYFLFQLHRNFSTKPNIHSTLCLSSQKKKFRTNQLIFTFGSYPLTGIFKRRTVLLLFPHRKKEFRHKYRFSTFFVPLAFPKGIQTQKNIVFRLIRFRLNFFK